MTRPGHAWFWMLALASVPFLMVLGNAVLIPILPEMQQALHITRLQTSLLITLFSVPAGLAIPVAGALSDRYSRKHVLLPALLLFGAGGIIAGAAAWWMPRKYPWIILGRVIQGIGASGTAPIAMALVGDIFQGADRSKALGMNEAGNALGKVMSPIIGAAVALWAWYGVFWVFPVLCVPLAVLLWRCVPPEPVQASPPSTSTYIRSLREVFKREGRWLTVCYLVGATALFTLFGVLFFLSDNLESTQGITGLDKGLILAIPLAALTVSSLTTGWWIRRQKTRMKIMMMVGLSLLTICLGAAALFTNRSWVLVGLLCGAACGTGGVLPSLNTLITSAVAEDHRGIVTSLYGSVRFLGVALGPPVFSWLLGFSPRLMFLIVAGLTLTCLGLTAWLIRPASGSAKGPQRTNRMMRPAMRHRARI